MSKVADTPLQDTAAAAVIPLMKEYGDKLNDLHAKLIDLRNEVNRLEKKGDETAFDVGSDLSRLQQLADKLTPPAKKLAQHVSQMIEHGKLDDYTRLELGLRLAEFEHALLTVKDV